MVAIEVVIVDGIPLLKVDLVVMGFVVVEIVVWIAVVLVSSVVIVVAI